MLGADAFVPPGTEKFNRYTSGAGASGVSANGGRYEPPPPSFEEDLLREMARELEGRGPDFDGRGDDEAGGDRGLPQSPNFGGASSGKGSVGGGGNGGKPDGGRAAARKAR